MARKPKRRHPQPPPVRRGPSLEEILEKVHQLHEEGRMEEALQVLEEAPLHLQQRVEILTLKGITLSALGRLTESLSVLEMARRRDPDNLFPLLMLGFLYDELGYPAHALRALRLLMENRDILPPDTVEEGEELLKELEEHFRQQAEEFGLPIDRTEELCYLMELSLRAFDERDFRNAVRYAQQVSRIAPWWMLPRWMVAEALFMEGRIREAIQTAEKVLEDHPDAIPVYSSLVRYHFARGDRERAGEVARTLKSLPIDNPLDLEEVVKALGLLEDDAGLYDLYRRYRKYVEEIEGPVILIVLACAAANLGHFLTGEQLLFWVMTTQGSQPDIPFIAFNELARACEKKLPAPGVNNRYPTVYLPWMLPYLDREELAFLFQEWADDKIPLSQARKRFRRLMERNPQLFYVLEQLLRSHRRAGAWINLLILRGTPEDIEEIHRFVLGQKGVLADRLVTAQWLAEEGIIDPHQPLMLWDELREEWRSLTVPMWRVKELDIPPVLRKRLERAMSLLEDDRMDEAEAVLREAIAEFPDQPFLYRSMAILYEMRGNPEEARRYYHKALEVDPNYLMAHIKLALDALQRGDIEAGRHHLAAVSQHEEFTPAELIGYLQASSTLALMEEDFSMALFYVENALPWVPEFQQPVLENLIRLIQIRAHESVTRLKKAMQRADRQRREPIRADASLEECLQRLNKENLKAICRGIGVSPVGRKDELVLRLVRVLTLPDWLKRTVESFSDEERRALRDVLDAGGVLPWDEFTSRYGHDLDENPFWGDHPPENLMGRLRFFGLISDGTLEGQRVVLMPVEMRNLLSPPLSQRGD